MKKRFGLIVTLALVLLLSGCMEYRESLNLNVDGSGYFTFKVGILDLEGFFDEETMDPFTIIDDEEELEQFPGIQVIESKTYTEDGVNWSEITIEFDSLETLVEVLSQEDYLLMGWATFTGEDGYLVYRRNLTKLIDLTQDNLGFGDEMDLDGDMALQMFTMILGDSVWSYEVTLPGRIVDSNALEQDINLVTNTVRWSHSAQDLVNQDLEMWVKIAP